MAKKKKHEEHVNHERWLVSYADFITLLFAFFVVLFSSSQVDSSKTNKMALAINAAFSNFSIFKEKGGQLNILGGENSSSAEGLGKHKAPMVQMTENSKGDTIYQHAEAEQEETMDGQVPSGDDEVNERHGMVTSEYDALARVQRNVIDLISRRKLHGRVEVITDGRGVTLSLREGGLFEHGTEEMTSSSRVLLSGLGQILSQVNTPFRIEGHTDNQKADGKKFPSNWELSSARSSYVARWLVSEFDIDPSRISVVGYGEYRPIASNETEGGRLRNRRVDLVLLSPEVVKKEMPVPKKKNPEFNFDGKIKNEKGPLENDIQNLVHGEPIH